MTLENLLQFGMEDLMHGTEVLGKQYQKPVLKILIRFMPDFHPGKTCQITTRQPMKKSKSSILDLPSQILYVTILYIYSSSVINASSS